MKNGENNSLTYPQNVDNMWITPTKAYLSDPENHNTFLQALASLDQSLTTLEEYITTLGNHRLATICRHLPQGTFALH